jgi:hypothetical protein
MADDRYTKLAPANIAMTLRSFPRRYREVLNADPSVDIDEIAHIAADGGRSILDVLTDTTRSLTLLDRALERTLVSAEPTLHRGVVDAHEREWPVDTADSVAGELAQLDEAASTLASRIDHVAAADWLRKARVTGGDEVTAQQIAQEAARTGAENLRVLERIVPEVIKRAKRSNG